MWREHGEYMYEVMVDGWYMYIKVEVYVAYIHCEIIQQKRIQTLHRLVYLVATKRDMLTIDAISIELISFEGSMTFEI